MSSFCYLLLFLLTVPEAKATLIGFQIAQADISSVTAAALATFGGMSALMQCSGLCNLNASCGAVAFDGPQCSLLNSSLLTNSGVASSARKVYVKFMPDNWGPWTPWTMCSASCGPDGTHSRTRNLVCTDRRREVIPCPSAHTDTTQTDVAGCHNFNCTCLTPTNGLPCLFPWYYHSTDYPNYPSCAAIWDPDGLSWCPTGVTADGVFISGSGVWDHCPSGCPECRTVDGPVVDAPCQFPFTYNGVEYYNCTRADNGHNEGRAWCCTWSDPVTQWGICDDERLCPAGNDIGDYPA